MAGYARTPTNAIAYMWVNCDTPGSGVTVRGEAVGIAGAVCDGGTLLCTGVQVGASLLALGNLDSVAGVLDVGQTPHATGYGPGSWWANYCELGPDTAENGLADSPNRLVMSPGLQDYDVPLPATCQGFSPGFMGNYPGDFNEQQRALGGGRLLSSAEMLAISGVTTNPLFGQNNFTGNAGIVLPQTLAFACNAFDGGGGSGVASAVVPAGSVSLSGDFSVFMQIAPSFSGGSGYFRVNDVLIDGVSQPPENWRTGWGDGSAYVYPGGQHLEGPLSVPDQVAVPAFAYKDMYWVEEAPVGGTVRGVVRVF